MVVAELPSEIINKSTGNFSSEEKRPDKETYFTPGKRVNEFKISFSEDKLDFSTKD